MPTLHLSQNLTPEQAAELVAAEFRRLCCGTKPKTVDLSVHVDFHRGGPISFESKLTNFVTQDWVDEQTAESPWDGSIGAAVERGGSLVRIDLDKTRPTDHPRAVSRMESLLHDNPDLAVCIAQGVPIETEMERVGDKHTFTVRTAWPCRVVRNDEGHVIELIILKPDAAT